MDHTTFNNDLDRKIQPPFDGIMVLRRAVKKAIRRKRALGQYAIIGHNGAIEKLDFSLKARD